MSGLFKNLDKVLNQSVFATNAHRYLLTNRFNRFNHSAYYYDPSVTKEGGITRGHNLDIFALTTCSYNLTRQTQLYQQILNEVKNRGTFVNFQQELENTIQNNNNALDQYLHNIFLQLKTGLFECPIDSSVSAVYSFAFSSQPLNVQQDVLQNVIENIQSKLHYASQSNLIDLIVALDKLQYYNDKQLWSQLLQAINKKVWDWQYQSVQYSGWKTDLYETGAQKSSCSGGEISNYWTDLQKGNTHLALVKRWLRKAYDQVQFRIIYPATQREYRIFYEFDSIGTYQEQENLFRTLENLADKVEQSKEVLANLRAKKQ